MRPSGSCWNTSDPSVALGSATRNGYFLPFLLRLDLTLKPRLAWTLHPSASVPQVLGCMPGYFILLYKQTNNSKKRARDWVGSSVCKLSGMRTWVHSSESTLKRPHRLALSFPVLMYMVRLYCWKTSHTVAAGPPLCWAAVIALAVLWMLLGKKIHPESYQALDSALYNTDLPGKLCPLVLQWA